MIIRAHQYFLNTRQSQTQRPDLPLRKEVAEYNNGKNLKAFRAKNARASKEN